MTFTSPVLTPGITMTDFIVNHVQANMMAISQQNDPVAIMQYAAAILNTLNEQARLADLADDLTEVANRTAVRDLFAVVLEGLPISTTYQIQLMAKVAEFLTVSITTTYQIQLMAKVAEFLTVSITTTYQIQLMAKVAEFLTVSITTTYQIQLMSKVAEFLIVSTLWNGGYL